MAFMIPTSLKNVADTTAGERKLFELFESMPDTCTVRYEMLLGERDSRPDFVIIDVTRGILIIEVKDWGVENIVGATKEQFNIRFRPQSPPKMIRNPDGKCNSYLRRAREQLVARPLLRDSNTDVLIVPVKYLIMFTNIAIADFTKHRLDELIPLSVTLTKEDLQNGGATLFRKFDEVLPRLPISLNAEQINEISAALLTDITISTGAKLIRENAGIVNISQQAFDSYCLSLEQEQIAKSLGEGPRLLRGIAGTGKTLIMLYRAKLLAANAEKKGQQVRILILCWNISLANYMRQAFDRLQIEVQDRQVTILHFAEFSRKVLGRRIDYGEFDNPGLFNGVETRVITEANQYDAIYIDEAQDFQREWIEYLFHQQLKGETPQSRNLLIAADDAQRIYPQRNIDWSDLVTDDATRLHQQGRVTWSKLGIPLVGRSKILKTVYRNSARVWIFAAFLLGDEASYVNKSTDKVSFSNKGGYDPQLIECANPSGQIEEAVNIIKRVTKSGYAARNILVLYRHKSFKGFDWAEQIQAYLNRAKISNEWIAEGHAKSTFEWEANTVKISSIHSAKGMDSPIVIVLGAETFIDNYGQDETKIMYVALTRAREFLVVLCSGNTGLVPELRECRDKYLLARDRIINRFE